VRSYKLRHFDLRELVTPELWATRNSRVIELLDPRALRVLDDLRDKFGPVTVNNWHTGGLYKESGLRDPFTQTGAMWSQHKFGRAFDCKFKNGTPRQVFDHLISHAPDWPEITVLEDVDKTPTWLHFDVRAASWEGIRVVQP
jgi:hypothetical protein